MWWWSVKTGVKRTDRFYNWFTWEIVLATLAVRHTQREAGFSIGTTLSSERSERVGATTKSSSSREGEFPAKQGERPMLALSLEP